MLKNFGITGPETIEEVGINAKMNEFQAAMGIINLKYIDEEIKNINIIKAQELFGEEATMERQKRISK